MPAPEIVYVSSIDKFRAYRTVSPLATFLLEYAGSCYARRRPWPTSLDLTICVPLGSTPSPGRGTGGVDLGAEVLTLLSAFRDELVAAGTSAPRGWESYKVFKTKPFRARLLECIELTTARALASSAVGAPSTPPAPLPLGEAPWE